MDISLEDKLAALGLEGEATASTRTGCEGGVNSFAVPIRWSRSYIGGFTLTSGQTLVASGTPVSYSDTVHRAGGYMSALERGPGTSGGHFSAPTRWAEGPSGSSQDEWCQCSTPHGSPPQCELCSTSPLGICSRYPLSSLQVLCNNRGQGTVCLWGAPISRAVLPVVDM